MLESRTIRTRLAEEELEVVAAKGCPQGGVLSPLLWSLVVDDLLVMLEGDGFKVQGYADDVAILIGGKFEETVSERLQVALNIVSRWCVGIGLNINPKKSTIVAFTRRRSRARLQKPTLFGETIEYSKEVKYLGLTIDEKLNFERSTG